MRNYGCHSLTILAWAWFWCFWLLLVALFGGYLLYMSGQETSIEDVTVYRNWLVVSAGIGSMVYVRCVYYPWLMAKKQDPVLPRHAPVFWKADDVEPAPSHPLTISLL